MEKSSATPGKRRRKRHGSAMGGLWIANASLIASPPHREVGRLDQRHRGHRGNDGPPIQRYPLHLRSFRDHAAHSPSLKCTSKAFSSPRSTKSSGAGWSSGSRSASSQNTRSTGTRAKNASTHSPGSASAA